MLRTGCDRAVNDPPGGRERIPVLIFRSQTGRPQAPQTCRLRRDCVTSVNKRKTLDKRKTSEWSPLVYRRIRQLPPPDSDTTWPPPILYQVPRTPPKKPIFREPVAQCLLLSGVVVIVALDGLHVSYNVFWKAACCVMFFDVMIITFVLRKVHRAKRNARKT